MNTAEARYSAWTPIYSVEAMHEGDTMGYFLWELGVSIRERQFVDRGPLF